jgi:UDP-glucose 4,6-dehydratase
MALYSPTNVLISGGAGFIASHLLNYMVPKYPEVKFVNIDRLDYCASLKNIKVSDAPNYTFVKGDIGSEDLLRYVLTTHKIDTVMHLAAQSSVCASFDNSLAFTKDNVLGTHVLLEAVRKYGGVKRFLNISTDEVVGTVEEGESSENTILRPTNPYSASKAGAELLAYSYLISYKLPIIVTRGNNVIGENQFPEKILPTFILQLLDGKRVTVHGDGSTKRNFMYVLDTVKALEVVLLKGEVGKIYNIGTNCEKTVLEIAEMLRQHITPDKTLEEIITYVVDRPYNDRRYAVNSSALRALGWKEETSLEEQLPSIIEWYRIHGKTQWA